MKILLAAPRGFCAGVEMAIGALERALLQFDPPLYVYHEIIHNQSVVGRFRERGVVFVDDLDDVPEGSILMFSAHGVAPSERQRARQRRLQTIDATCPLVNKVHMEVARFARQGYTVFLIGHAGHDEVVGTMGVAPRHIRLVQTVEDVDQVEVADPAATAYVTQTTLSMDDTQRIVQRLRQRFPQIVAPPNDDICYATQNRQAAVKNLLGEADVVLVIGSQNSSNSNRLAEIARAQGHRGYLIDGASQIHIDWFEPDDTVLITAGASAPEELVQQCVTWLSQHFPAQVQEYCLTVEHAWFPLPRELRHDTSSSNQETSALPAPKATRRGRRVLRQGPSSPSGRGPG